MPLLLPLLPLGVYETARKMIAARENNVFNDTASAHREKRSPLMLTPFLWLVNQWSNNKIQALREDRPRINAADFLYNVTIGEGMSLLSRLRRSAPDLQKTAKATDPLDYEYVTHIYFKEKGKLAGATTYGHMSFEYDLAYVDTLLAGVTATIQQHQRDLATKEVVKRLERSAATEAPGAAYKDKITGIYEAARAMGFAQGKQFLRIETYLVRLQSEQEKLSLRTGGPASMERVPITAISEEYEAYKREHWLDIPADPIIELISFHEAEVCWARGQLVSVKDRVNDLRPYPTLIAGAEALSPTDFLAAVATGNSTASERFRRAARIHSDLEHSLNEALEYQKRMTAEWSDMKKALGITESHLSRDGQGRPKRFIPLLIGGITALIGLSGTVMGAVAVDKLLDIESQAREQEETANAREQVHEQKHQFIVAKLQKITDQQAKIEEALTDLRKENEWLKEGLEDTVAELEYVKLTNYVTALQNLERGELDRLFSGLTTIMHERLSPILINATTVDESLRDLRKKAELSGFDTPAHALYWVYQLPASFVGHPNGKLLVFIHVPLHMRGHLMNLYEYLDVPVAIQGSKHSLTIEPETRFLAVNPDRDGFLMLREEDLSRCETIGSFFWCANYNYQLKEPAKYCITSLFWRMQESAHTICKTAVATDSVQIVQSTQNTFHLFHPSPMPLTVQCPAEAEKHLEWRGSKQLRLEPGCRGFGRGYEINAYPEYSSNVTIVTSELSWATRQLTLNLPPIKLDEMLPEPPKVKIMVEDLVGEYNKIANAEKFIGPLSPSRIIHNLFGGFLSTVSIVVVILIVMCCFKDRIIAAINTLLTSPNVPTSQDRNLPAADTFSLRSLEGATRGILRRVRKEASKMGSRVASLASLASIDSWRKPHGGVAQQVGRELQQFQRQQSVRYAPPPGTPVPQARTRVVSESAFMPAVPAFPEESVYTQMVSPAPLHHGLQPV